MGKPAKRVEGTYQGRKAVAEVTVADTRRRRRRRPHSSGGSGTHVPDALGHPVHARCHHCGVHGKPPAANRGRASH